MSPRGYLALVMLTALSATACSEKHWTKPGATAEDFNRDNHACALEAQRGVFSYSGTPVNKRTYRNVSPRVSPTRGNRIGASPGARPSIRSPEARAGA